MFRNSYLLHPSNTKNWPRGLTSSPLLVLADSEDSARNMATKLLLDTNDNVHMALHNLRITSPGIGFSRSGSEDVWLCTDSVIVSNVSFCELREYQPTSEEPIKVLPRSEAVRIGLYKDPDTPAC